MFYVYGVNEHDASRCSNEVIKYFANEDLANKWLVDNGEQYCHSVIKIKVEGNNYGI